MQQRVGWQAHADRRPGGSDVAPPRQGFAESVDSGSPYQARETTSQMRSVRRSGSSAWPAASATAISSAAHCSSSGLGSTISSIQAKRPRSRAPVSGSIPPKRATTTSGCPSSKASSAAASSRWLRCAVSPSSAARRVAVTATAVAPRRRARRPASSSSAATSSCVPLMSAARCQTRRSGSSASTSASASWTRRRRSIGAAWPAAERINGWRKRTLRSSSSTMATSAAGWRASTPTRSFATKPPASGLR